MSFAYRRSFVFSMMLMMVVLSLAAGSGFSAIVIGGDPGEVTPANINLVPSQPAVPLNVGINNNGTLLVDGGDTIDTSVGVIGSAAGSTGVVTIDGAGSEWNIHNASGGSTFIGQAGNGTLNITNGGVVNNNDPLPPPLGGYSMETGLAAGSVGTINVDGAGSQLNTDALTIGRVIGATSNLNITNGGTVTVYDFNLGQQGTANLNIDTGGTLIVNGTTYLGTNGTGTVVIDGGGTIQSNGDAYINRNPGSDVPVTVTGAGTSWDIIGTLTVGENGELTTSDTATVNVGNDLIIQDGAVVTVENGTAINVGDQILVENGGLLDLQPGSTLVSNILIDPAGAYDGSGDVTGNVTVEGLMWNDATVAGQTLNITGNYLLASGGTLTINIDRSTGLHNKINVDGDAEFEDGSRIHVVQQGPVPIVETEEFDILEATGTLTTPATQRGIRITDNTPFLNFTWEARGSTLWLIAQKASNFAPVALGRNRLSMAMGLDNMLNNGTGTPAQDNMLAALQMLSASQFNAALSQLVPEQYIAFGRDLPNMLEAFHRDLGAHLSALRNGYVPGGSASNELAARGIGMDMRLASTEIDPETLAAAIEEQQEQTTREEALTDPDNVTDTKWSVWGQITNNWDSQKSTNDLRGWRNHTWGVITGVDRQIVQSLRIGALFGYSRSEYHFRESRGNLEVDSIRVGPYMDWTHGNLFVEAALTFGYHWNDVRRDINFPGISDSSHSNYDSWDLSPYARIGYTFHLGGWNLTPSMGFQYVYYSQDGTSEHGGSGATNLAIKDWSQNSFRQLFMLELSRMFDLRYVKLIPAFMVGYSIEYIGDESLSYNFVNQGYPMTFWPGETGGNRALWGTSLTALLSDDLSVFIRYDGSAGNRNINQSLTGGVRVKF